MTDKIQKIREEVERLQKRAEHNFDISLTENERQFWLGESNVLTLIGKHIDTLQEESVSEDLEMAAKEDARVNRSDDTDDSYDLNRASGFVAGAQWQKQQMMKEAITGQLENGEDYLRIKCLSASCRPQDNGKMVKLIIVKEQ